MNHRTSRQIALLALLASCMTIVMILLAAGFQLDIANTLPQALPLALVCAAALVFLLREPMNSGS